MRDIKFRAFNVNLPNEERWYRQSFATKDEAIQATKNTIINQDLESEVFGEKFKDYDDESGNHYQNINEFVVGKLTKLPTPADLGGFVIEYLDEVAWIDYGFADDYPSDYIFDKEDKEKLSQLLADFIDKRIDKSG